MRSAVAPFEQAQSECSLVAEDPLQESLDSRARDVAALAPGFKRVDMRRFTWPAEDSLCRVLLGCSPRRTPVDTVVSKCRHGTLTPSAHAVAIRVSLPATYRTVIMVGAHR